MLVGYLCKHSKLSMSMNGCARTAIGCGGIIR